MFELAAAFLVALSISLILTPWIRTAALRLGAIDHALTSRKIHGRPVPRLGGIAIVAAFLVTLALRSLWNGDVAGWLLADHRQLPGILLGSLAITLLGVVDDLRGSSARAKLAVQLGAAAFLWWAGFRIERIATPFGAPVELGAVGFPLTLLWIAGVTNALNLIDGLDGLAGGVGFTASVAMLWISWQAGAILPALFMASLAGALLGFLRYNFNPASIFMGDSGSMFIGFVLAATSLQANVRVPDAVALLVPIVALGLPIGDTLVSMARRALRGQPVFVSDRGHIHHRLLGLGLSHRTTVIVLYLVSAVLGAFAVALSRADGPQTVAFLVALVAFALLLLSVTGYVRPGETGKLLRDRRRNLEMRAAVRRAAMTLRSAARPEDVWQAVKGLAPAVGAPCAGLTVVCRNGDVQRTEYAHGFDDASEDLFRARFSLMGERPDEGYIELGWNDGRSGIDRDTEIAVELLCEHVRETLERLDVSDQAGRRSNLVSFRR